MSTHFEKRFKALKKAHDELIRKKNKKEELGNGIYDRYENPVLTAGHAPIFWRYDLNPGTNPFRSFRRHKIACRFIGHFCNIVQISHEYIECIT